MRLGIFLVILTLTLTTLLFGVLGILGVEQLLANNKNQGLPLVHAVANARWFGPTVIVLLVTTTVLWSLLAILASKPSIGLQANVNYLIQQGVSLRASISVAETQAKHATNQGDEFREVLQEAMTWTRQCVRALGGTHWQKYFKQGHPSGMNLFQEGNFKEVLEWVDNRIERLRHILSRI
jgi:hypothetical protein